jgi:heme A synthase
MTRSSNPVDTDGSARDTVPVLFSAIIGLTSIVILLQGVWAGIFIRQGEAYNASWIKVHDWGARLAILLALAAAILAIAQLRHRRDLLIGSVALFVLLLLEAYIGGLIADSPGAEAVHFPLAMALLALCVWLPLRTRHNAVEGRSRQ